MEAMNITHKIGQAHAQLNVAWNCVGEAEQLLKSLNLETSVLRDLSLDLAKLIETLEWDKSSV